MVCCTFGKMNKGSTTEERKEFNMTTGVRVSSTTGTVGSGLRGAVAQKGKVEDIP